MAARQWPVTSRIHPGPVTADMAGSGTMVTSSCANRDNLSRIEPDRDDRACESDKAPRDTVPVKR